MTKWLDEMLAAGGRFHTIGHEVNPNDANDPKVAKSLMAGWTSL